MEHEPQPYFISDSKPETDLSLPENFKLPEEVKEKYRREGKTEQWIQEEETRRRYDLIDKQMKAEGLELIGHGEQDRAA